MASKRYLHKKVKRAAWIANDISITISPYDGCNTENRIAAAAANGRPKGRKYAPFYHGFDVDKHGYFIEVDGKIGRIKYVLARRGWVGTAAGKTVFFDRDMLAEDIKDEMTALLRGQLDSP